MKRNRFFLISILLFLSVACVFGSMATRPNISASFGGVFCHPTADYLGSYPGNSDVETPPFRTSYSYGFDFRLFDISYIFDESVGNAVNLDAGFSIVNVSQSLPFGISVLKPYSGMGLMAGIGYSFNPMWSVDLRYRFLNCKFKGTSSKFIAHEIELSPSMRFYSVGALDFRVDIPVTMSIKADAVSIRTSIQLTLLIDSKRVVRSSAE